MTRKRRDEIVACAMAKRQALERLHASQPTMSDLRVMNAIEMVVVSYSNLSDRVSRRQLAEKAGVSEKTVTRSLDRMAAAGVIEYTKSPGRGMTVGLPPVVIETPSMSRFDDDEREPDRDAAGVPISDDESGHSPTGNGTSASGKRDSAGVPPPSSTEEVPRGTETGAAVDRQAIEVLTNAVHRLLPGEDVNAWRSADLNETTKHIADALAGGWTPSELEARIGRPFNEPIGDAARFFKSRALKAKDTPPPVDHVAEALRARDQACNETAARLAAIAAAPWLAPEVNERGLMGARARLNGTDPLIHHPESNDAGLPAEGAMA